MKTTNIYVLSDGDKYYIGKADDVWRRYMTHTRKAYWENSEVYHYKISKWIRSYGNKQKARKNIKILYSFNIWDRFWKIAEIKHIAYYRKVYGYDKVMNQHHGGEGAAVPKGEDHPHSKLTWPEVNAIRDSKELCRTLADQYFVSQSLIKKIWGNIIWYDPNYTPRPRYQESLKKKKFIGYDKSGENHPKARLTWYDVFLFRMSYIPRGQGKCSLKYAIERLGVSKSMLHKISLNINWYDENWDPKSHTYIGPPHGWEESWDPWD